MIPSTRSLLACSILSLGALASSAVFAAPVTVSANHVGWVDNYGVVSNASSQNSLTAHDVSGTWYNSWASFDLSSLSGQVLSARLEVHSSTWFVLSGLGAAYDYRIGVYDVSAGTDVLSTSHSSAVFDDLGGGAQYASAWFPNGSTQTLDLSSQAVADLNALLGSNFRVGFSDITDSNDPARKSDGMYINGDGWYGKNKGNFTGPTLILELAAPDGNHVPEPATLALLGLGFVASAATTRRKV